ncbi:LysE family translocator [Microvirga rosea]|uniref:LysE family translocator n=1 Tax=Microvirga rosea TaxID=2715425 RepID=UPI001D0A52CA|nr:LysE family translocator [Microvirga rosea]MCB8823098.1 LysE family translocator [Microvirga rosea]
MAGFPHPEPNAWRRTIPSPSTLLLFVGAALVLAALPGPGLFYIAGRTLAAGRADGLASCVGSALGGLVHVLAGAVGVSALIMASATAFTVLKLVGGLYLIWLGIQTWRSAKGGLETLQAAPVARRTRTIRQGFVVEATNPKTAAFFLALIPQFIDPSQGHVAMQFSIFGLISVLLNTSMGVLVVVLATKLRQYLAGRAGVLSRLRQSSAIILASLGVSLLLTRRPT